MTKRVDIHKAAGILVRDRKLLVARSKNKEHFISPGGTIEAGETPEQALARELMEEFQIKTRPEDFEKFGIFYAEAAGQPGHWLQMDVFIVAAWEGELTADNEVEEIRWVTSRDIAGMPIGSIFEHEVMPRLVAKGIID